MTTEGMYNPEKVDREYTKILERLNSHELALLVHKLVEDKRYLVKTVNLIQEQLAELS